MAELDQPSAPAAPPAPLSSIDRINAAMAELDAPPPAAAPSPSGPAFGTLDHLPGETDQQWLERRKAIHANEGAWDRAKASVTGWFKSDFCECIFEYMPKVENDVAAGAIRDKCRSQSESIYICKSQAGSWFGIKTAPECIEKYATTTHSELGARIIAQACRKAF